MNLFQECRERVLCLVGDGAEVHQCVEGDMNGFIF